MHVEAGDLDEDGWLLLAPPVGRPRNPALDDIEARRCAVCGCRHPAFGYVPPAVPKGELWACAAHRGEVEAQTRTPTPNGSDAQPSLL